LRGGTTAATLTLYFEVRVGDRATDEGSKAGLRDFQGKVTIVPLQQGFMNSELHAIQFERAGLFVLGQFFG
jgi:hypothetical protein